MISILESFYKFSKEELWKQVSWKQCRGQREGRDRVWSCQPRSGESWAHPRLSGSFPSAPKEKKYIVDWFLKKCFGPGLPVFRWRPPTGWPTGLHCCTWTMRDTWATPGRRGWCCCWGIIPRTAWGGWGGWDQRQAPCLHWAPRRWSNSLTKISGQDKDIWL